jgi:STE24 endopeptidase
MPVALVIVSLLAAAPAFAADPANGAANAAASTSATPGEKPIVTPPLHSRAEVDAATEAYLSQLSPEARARSDSYFEGGYWLILWDALVGVAVALVFLATGLSARMRDLAERITRFRFLQVALYAAGYFLIGAALTFPMTVYEGFFREHRYNLSNQTFGQWMGDQFKELIITLIIAPVIVAIIYLVIRKAPRTWALWGAIVAIAFVSLVGAVEPVYIAPIFNTYKPLAESPLKEKIVSLARANGIPATEVWQFDASKQTKRMSANVSGMFNTTRISLNDNLLNRASPEEIQAVMGHEMGHYVLNHVYKFIALFGIVIVVLFFLLKSALEASLRRWGASWKLHTVDDVAALPLLVVIFSLLFTLATPVNNSIIRSQEAEADMFGLNASRQPDGFARAALHLSEYRKMRPGPVEEFIFFDHPSGWNRIHRSMAWKAEHLQDPDMVVQRSSF